MLSKNIYKFYGPIMKFMGYERSIFRYIKKLPIEVRSGSSILDAGCGTGVAGLSLMKKSSESKLLATDLDERFLHQVINKAKKRGLDSTKVSTGISDIISPNKVTVTDGSSITLKEKQFDVVVASGAIGYSKNQSETLQTLLHLVKPGGHFINLEMKENLLGRMVAKKYKYSVMSIDMMINTIKSKGFIMQRVPLRIRNFPANITRNSIIAQRPQ